ncbi:ENTH-domain-containing [Pyrrhoderma noxium]|uniref:ENTH-domain-containing n=1 Tax=Pyrrhoderma noxium TaxID=2282107 RepID=A0A286UB68_9AGAM|nr:ENTH-domain-containing [Pyrrhoderma noxium]
MDRLESLGNAISQVTLYDIKSMYNQAKNMVLNVSEMEAKVREATNDEPWGASSTLMQEIAQGTFNFQQFNEIMPCIYSRFMDKEARQWREIYKALQLLEYIVKHGSERVVDDARSHLSTIKMLRNFHYIDDKGKDQGINVRNRAKELAELLMDVDRIRSERRKAKANRNKYVGTGNDPMSFVGSGSRYGGFGSDSVSSGSRNYGGGYDRDYGGYSGGSSSGFRDDSGRRGFDEYNAGDDEISGSHRSNSITTESSFSTIPPRTSSTAASSTVPSKSQEKVVDLLGFDDDDFAAPISAPPTASGKEKALPALAALDDADDDFADFQAAPNSPAPTASKVTSAPAAQAKTTTTASNIFDALGSSTPLSSSTSPVTVTSRPGLGMGGIRANVSTNIGGTKSSVNTPTSGTGKGSTSVGFDDLWNMSLGSTGKPSLGATGSGGGVADAAKTSSGLGCGVKSMKDLEKEKAQASIWGSQNQSRSQGQFGGFESGTTSAGGGGDDLLL